MADFDLPETSFEDIDTTFSRDIPTASSSNIHHGKQDLRSGDKFFTGPSQPTPSSLTTSDTGTVFSNSRDKPWMKNFDSEDDRSDGFEEGEEFLSDFQEFQNRKDDFDEAIKTHFNVASTIPTKTTSRDLSTEFESKLNIPPVRQNLGIRQPRSLMNLHPINSSSSFGIHRLQNSSSAHNLQRPSRPSGIHLKKSMPSLSSYNPIIEEEPKYWKKSWDIEEEDENDDYFNDFDEGDQDTFDLDEKTLQSRVRTTNDPSRTPFKISSSQFDIIQQDDLLTPRLHRRQKEAKYYKNLEKFKDREALKDSNNRHQSAKSKIKTIKQQIDHNTPIKSGLMYYNPQKMTWEGNERVLDKFQDITSLDKRPILIRNKSTISPNDTLTYNTVKNKRSTQSLDKHDSSTRSSSSNPRIVGKMMFDERNLRWVSVNNDEVDPFADIDEAIPEPNSFKKKNSSPFLRSRSQLASTDKGSFHPEKRSLNSMSSKTNLGQKERYASTSAVAVHRTQDGIDYSRVYRLSTKELEKLYHEENRWQRKVGGWFVLGDSDQQDQTMAQFDPQDKANNFMYEIRKMVINSTKS